MNPYKTCPQYETESFLLRLVTLSDAEDLLSCYSDKTAVQLMNSDVCTNDFYYQTLDEMQQAIRFWLEEYRQEKYVRFAIIEKATTKAVGTVEMYDGAFSVLRIDICSAHETENSLSEIFGCAVQNFYYDFKTDIICFKFIPGANIRNKVLIKFGFSPTDEFRPGYNYYARKKRYPIACCGLACCVCTHDDTCTGCQTGGCESHSWCKNYNWCREKGLNGCWECDDFPCEGTMLDKPRIYAFAAFAKEYGVEELTKYILQNRENGIVYHYKGQLIGDYDNCGSKEAVWNMLKTGKQ